MGKHSNVVQIFKCGQCRGQSQLPLASCRLCVPLLVSPILFLLLCNICSLLFTIFGGVLHLQVGMCVLSVYEIFRSTIRKVPRPTHTPTCSWLKYCEKCKIVYGAAAGKQNKQINKQILHLQQQGADRIAHLVRKNARHSVFHAALINKNNSRKVSDKLLDQSPVWKVAKFFERHLKITVQSCQIHGKSTLKYISSIQNFLTRKKNTTLVEVVSLKSL